MSDPIPLVGVVAQARGIATVLRGMAPSYREALAELEKAQAEGRVVDEIAWRDSKTGRLALAELLEAFIPAAEAASTFHARLKAAGRKP